MISQTKNIYHPDVYLAMAILCFCPPDICVPPSPTNVSNPFGSLSIKLKAFASLHAFSMSSSDALKLPSLMFSFIVRSNRTGS